MPIFGIHGTDIDFYSKLRLTNWADKKHKRLEKTVLSKADRVVTVSPGCARDLSNIVDREIEIVNNGYDPADFEFEEEGLDKKFTISHFGAFNKDRNPVNLWNILGKLAEEDSSFKENLEIQLIGQTDNTILESIKDHNLYDNVSIIEHLPHKKGLSLLRSSQVLLLPLNNAPNVMGILPGKMYEYLALKRPILAIGPTNADYAKIINETQSGSCHDFDDKTGMQTTIREYYKLFNKNTLQINSNSFQKYSRKNLAQNIIDIATK